MVRKNILTPHLETPKDVATKSGEDTSETQLSQPCKISRRDICPRREKNTHTGMHKSDLISDKKHTSITVAG